MKTVRLSPPAKLIFALLIAFATSFLVPQASKAQLCCGYGTSTIYYSDASRTTVVGSCSDDCYANGPSCTGDTSTVYTRYIRTCCSQCIQ
jgi:hypothetical protein